MTDRESSGPAATLAARPGDHREDHRPHGGSPGRVLSQPETVLAKERTDRLLAELGRAILGQQEMLELVVISLLARGHLLLEGLPGLGKTELVKSLSKLLGLSFQRVQFTPDLLPGDILGSPILEEVEGRRQLVFHQGPIFANLVLADEINRASPKTQSALLEAMQERRVTILGETHALPLPFFVLATQNPIELEGTYPLPEAQLDRFTFKINVHGVSSETLREIITTRSHGDRPSWRKFCPQTSWPSYFARPTSCTFRRRSPITSLDWSAPRIPAPPMRPRRFASSSSSAPRRARRSLWPSRRGAPPSFRASRTWGSTKCAAWPRAFWDTA